MYSPSGDPPLRILLIGNYVPDGQQSMQRYARELASGLARLGVQVTVVTPPKLFGRAAFGSTALAKWLGWLDKFVAFTPRLLFSRKRFDIVHIADHANAFYQRWFPHDTVVVTCHDLFAVRGMLGQLPDHRPRMSGRKLQQLILNSLRQCPAIICVSEATAQDVRALIKPALQEVIPNAIRAELTALEAEVADAELKPIGVSAPYFLHVGGNQFYKNRPGVVRVFDRLAESEDYRSHRLVLAGKAPDKVLRDEIQAARHRNRISVIISPSDIVVQALYSRAEALLFLSTSEGFGWPIIEAQACGCVVITTDSPPMSYVGGAAAILVDLNDTDFAAGKIVQELKEKVHRRSQGLENAANYDAEHVCRCYLSFYRRALHAAKC
jgi:glycosyltransferase involved in cell wall biosynthesis